MLWLSLGGVLATIVVTLVAIFFSMWDSPRRAGPAQGSITDLQRSSDPLLSKSTLPPAGSPSATSSARRHTAHKTPSTAMPMKPIGPSLPATVAPRTAQTATGDAVRDCLPSVAIVECPDGNGSGFILRPGLLVTNHHVIEKSRIGDLRISFPDHPTLKGRRFPAELVAENPVVDLAVLRVACDVVPLRTDDQYEHTNGQKIVAIGSPGTGGEDSLKNLTTDGRLGPPYTLPDGGVRWALSLPINPGNSGGPIIDATSGKVLAVAVAKFTRTEAQGLAVPHKALVEFVRLAATNAAAEQKRAGSLHRQRYCFTRMVEILQVLAYIFDRSCRAATAASSDDGEEMLRAFNGFKESAAEKLAAEFATFETVIGAECEALRHDEDCDPAVRLGLGKLHDATANQIAALRQTVRPSDIGAFLPQFKASVARAKSIASSVGGLLQVNVEEPEEEEE